MIWKGLEADACAAASGRIGFSGWEKVDLALALIGFRAGCLALALIGFSERSQGKPVINTAPDQIRTKINFEMSDSCFVPFVRFPKCPVPLWILSGNGSLDTARRPAERTGGRGAVRA